MMKTDERIALLTSILLDKWKLNLWADFQYEESEDRIRTYLSTFDENDEEILTELKTLEDVAVFWETEQEFACNIQKMWDSHSEEPIFTDDLIPAVVSRLNRTDVELPYSLITLANWTVPSVDVLPVFTDEQEESGRFAIQVLKMFGETEDLIGVTVIHNVQERWDNSTGEWVKVSPFFTVSVLLENLFLFSCDEELVVTPENVSLLVKAIDDVRFVLPVWEDENYCVEDWMVWLFACYVDDRPISSHIKSMMPVEVVDLFESTKSYSLDPFKLY